MINKITSLIEKQILNLQSCLQELNNSELIKTIDINESHLHETFRSAKKFSKSKEFNELYKSLCKDKPVLYWFTFDKEKFKEEELKFDFEYIKINTAGRGLSFLPKTYNRNSNTLYVGKVKKNFHYRFVNHLGHSVNNKTVSLQLTYWYDVTKYGNLKLNYIVLDKGMEALISVLEVELAKELMPIIGSHKN
jgi:hypothetical protein